jgi:hypothetical protein
MILRTGSIVTPPDFQLETTEPIQSRHCPLSRIRDPHRSAALPTMGVLWFQQILRRRCRAMSISRHRFPLMMNGNAFLIE